MLQATSKNKKVIKSFLVCIASIRFVGRSFIRSFFSRFILSFVCYSSFFRSRSFRTFIHLSMFMCDVIWLLAVPEEFDSCS